MGGLYPYMYGLHNCKQFFLRVDYIPDTCTDFCGLIRVRVDYIRFTNVNLSIGRDASTSILAWDWYITMPDARRGLIISAGRHSRKESLGVPVIERMPSDILYQICNGWTISA